MIFVGRAEAPGLAPDALDSNLHIRDLLRRVLPTRAICWVGLAESPRKGVWRSGRSGRGQRCQQAGGD
jgi:hypothetical protein